MKSISNDLVNRRAPVFETTRTIVMVDHILSILMNSIRLGDLKRVRELIGRHGLSYTKYWSEGYVLLRTAIENHRTDIAELLLTNGARVNTKNCNPCDTPLHIAIRNCDIEIVKMLLDRNANVNAKSRKGLTPLLMSIENGNIEITKLLLNQGADINITHYGLLPLHIAVEKGCIQIAEDLINHGASINAECTFESRGGYTPLHLACGLQHYQFGDAGEEIVKLLLRKNADINAVAKDNLTPLYVASINGHETVVKLLLELGANVDVEDKNGKAVLYLAVEKEHETIVKLLLEHGANVDTQDKDGKTILHLAAEGGYSIIIENILKYCPDVNNKSNRTSLHTAIHGNGENYTAIVENLLKYGFTVDSDDVSNCKLLYDAVGRGYLTIVEAILNYGADVNMSLKYKKKTLLHTASRNNRVEIAKLLIKSGADVNAKDKAERTPIYYATKYKNIKIVELLLTNGANIKDSPEVLHEAIMKGCREIVEMFIECGADINAGDKLGRTALHFTAFSKYTRIIFCHEDSVKTVKGEIAELLVNEGANINAQTKTGITPLHEAIDHGYARVVEILLNNGADINSQQENGLTALHIATRVGNKTIVKVLLEGGAKIVSEFKKRSTPLHIAVENGYLQIVKNLLEFGADIDSRDAEGRTALYIACKQRREGVITDLLEYGSNINNINIESVIPGIGEFNDDYNYCIPSRDNSDYDFKNDYDSNNDYDYSHDNSDSDSDNNSDQHCIYIDYIRYIHYSNDSDYKYSYKYDYDCPSDDLGGYAEIAEILHGHIVKIRTANFYVSEENLYWLKTTQAVDYFTSEYEEESETMKGEKIGNSNVSFSDFLTEDINQLVIFVRNENVEQVLKSHDYKRKFPHYAGMINNCFRRGVERKKLLEQSITFFHSLFNSLPELPYNCTEKIVSYLNNTDLRTLIDTCNSSNTDSR